MESMKEKLTEYAQLLVRVGLNIQRGQPLVISSPVECAFFARLCAAEAYQAGCREVVMNWGDDELGRMKYLHAADEVFDTVPLWRRHFYNDYAWRGRRTWPSPPAIRRTSRAWTTAGSSGSSRPAEGP